MWPLPPEFVLFITCQFTFPLLDFKNSGLGLGLGLGSQTWVGVDGCLEVSCYVVLKKVPRLVDLLKYLELWRSNFVHWKCNPMFFRPKRLN